MELNAIQWRAKEVLEKLFGEFRNSVRVSE